MDDRGGKGMQETAAEGFGFCFLVEEVRGDADARFRLVVVSKKWDFVSGFGRGVVDATMIVVDRVDLVVGFVWLSLLLVESGELRMPSAPTACGDVDVFAGMITTGTRLDTDDDRCEDEVWLVSGLALSFLAANSAVSGTSGIGLSSTSGIACCESRCAGWTSSLASCSSGSPLTWVPESGITEWFCVFASAPLFPSTCSFSSEEGMSAFVMEQFQDAERSFRGAIGIS